jgi:hypothetical protein
MRFTLQVFGGVAVLMMSACGSKMESSSTRYIQSEEYLKSSNCRGRNCLPRPTATPTATATPTPTATPIISATPTPAPTPQPTATPIAGVDPHPEQYPPVMGTPGLRDPDTLAPVTTYPVKQAELPKVPSNFNRDNYVVDLGAEIRPAWAGNEDVGAFRFQCKPSHNLYDDPIVYPGQPGASHLHTFFGNTLTNANSTYASLRSSGDGTCAGGPINRSAYWFPSLRLNDGDGNDLNDQVVMPDIATVYYKMPPLHATLFPRGLRLVFGYNMNNPAASNSTFNWGCLAKDTGGWRGNSSHASLKALADDNVCQAGDTLIVQIGAPTCWNGMLDSSDHRAHVVPVINSNLGYFACPITHPYHFPSFFLAINWKIGPTGNAEVQKFYLSSDRMPGMTHDAGSTMHTDWFGAWDDDVATEWMLHADAGLGNCSGGDMCDGRYLKDPFTVNQLNGYSNFWEPANPRLVAPPVKP